VNAGNEGLIGGVRAFGAGPPLVLIPGIQGRWEWMRPAIDALATRHRVYTFSLGLVRTENQLFDGWSRVIDRISASHAGGVPVVGISFGGVVAADYAGRRPGYVSRLVLVSTPSPAWQLDRRSAAYVKYPRLALPLFAFRGAARFRHEVRAALPDLGRRARFAIEHLGRTLLYPPSPPQMARCVREWHDRDLLASCRQITAPTLVVTGEPGLDRVVPVASSLDYLRLLPDARHATLERTGHLGLVLRPREFASLVTDFVHGTATGPPPAASDLEENPHGARGPLWPGRAS